MKILNAPLAELPAYNSIIESLKEFPSCVVADGCVESQMLHLLHAAASDEKIVPRLRRRLLITYSSGRARELLDQSRFYERNSVYFPAKDLIFYQADIRGKELTRERICALRKIMEGRPVTVITTFSALMTPQIPWRDLKTAVLHVRKQEEISLTDFGRRLTAIGYEKIYQVERPGQFAIRGDILDIYDFTQENPFRIELWGDEVESVRSFDVLTQRSVEELDSVEIYPATEMVLPARRLHDGLARIRSEADRVTARLRDQENPEAAARLRAAVSEMVEEADEWQQYGALESCIHYFYPATETFLDLFSPDDTLLVWDEPYRVREHAQAVELEFRESMQSRVTGGYILPGQAQLLRSAEEVTAAARQFRTLCLSAFGQGTEFLEPQKAVSIHTRNIAPYNRSFDTLEKDLRRFRKEGYRTLLVSPSRTRARRLAQDLTADDIPAFYSENSERTLRPGEVMTFYGHLQRGFEYPDLKLALITETDIFGEEKRRKKKTKKYSGESIRAFSELRAGDYVVHEDYGIGIYRGVEKVEVDHISKDYLKIEYGGGGTLYVLPTELGALQKYSTGTDRKPRLNRLGGSEWSTTKAKVRGAVAEVADDLVTLYAHRIEQKGHVFGPDTVWQKEFEEMFPFEETDDQLAAIEDTKRDMESDRIMDRLICGDVGYGKTEIAIRAAFKAAQEGMQTAVLVPTTILAQQHYNTFTERMHNYPVNIELLSRFRTAAEQKETLSRVRSGLTDIIIGTHRLLSKDVRFKNLGLLVVDEEQRFGVTHKEKIKKMKENVDVLTLSATPIPRTLHMSLAGIRDMSVLEEAPGDRVPIQTYVMEYNEEMVREAIVREISRGGQVYYVYNRVENIDKITARISEMVPEARVAFAHGQMRESELEQIMYRFIGGEIDVLVSTTIIETGLDISNVNTIIIHDSDRMGLSQLYQLRGRVGRSSRTAYAFLMYRKDRILREMAEKRLSAIREYTDLGSGFRIAMRDLEIRGAGSILGRSQHGHMASVGYDLYCKLLSEAVQEAKGEKPKAEQPVKVALSVDAYLPESFIVNETQKLEIYKKIAAVASTEDYEELMEEMRDRFGEIPAPAQNLLRIALLRSVAARVGVSEISGNFGSIRLIMGNAVQGLHAENIPKILANYRKNMTFSAAGSAAGRGKERGADKGPGAPEFLYQYKPVGVTVRDEQILLNTVEEILVVMARYLL